MANHQLFISFYLNKHRIDKQGECPVSMRITINGSREVVNTGVSTDPKSWDSSKGRIKGKSETSYSQNNLLNTWKSKATTIYADLVNSGMPLSSMFIKNKLLGTDDKTTTLMEVVIMHNAYVNKKVGIEVCRATHTKYETLRKKLQSYIQLEYDRSDLFHMSLIRRLRLF